MLKTLVWAKSEPHKSLVAHMMDTGVCAREYLRARSSAALLTYLTEQWHCTADEAIDMAAYLCAIHDEGKASPAFQGRSETERAAWEAAGLGKMLDQRTDEPFRHEYYSETILSALWKRDLALEGYARRAFGRMVSQHHQKEDRGRKSIHDKKKRQFWEQEQERIEAEIRALFLRNRKLELPEHVNGGCTLLLGLMILCDWVASSKPFEGLDEEAPDYMERAGRRARKALLDYGLIGEECFPRIDTFARMWPQIEQPRPLQKACMNLDDRALLTIIEAPMGEGKTEAALYLAGRMCGARKKRGIYVALPTQATSNSMHRRVEAMLEEIGAGAARLMHGTAFLLQDKLGKDNAEAAQWLKPMRLALLGGHAVGTVDQAMAAVLTIRFSVLRLLGLQNKVLVIDEVHAYDSYMQQIIEMLLKWCCAMQIPVILLSATMRKEQREAYLACYGATFAAGAADAYPMITQVSEAGKVSTTEFPAHSCSRYRFVTCAMLEDMEKIAQTAVDRVRDGGCLCVLMNTVQQAQAVYREIRSRKQADCETLLFHARFTAERRAEIENACLSRFGKGNPAKRPAKAILVATAVVEQSLDLDFDGMISQIAPMDLLLQRAGRVHRHEGRMRPEGLKEPVIEVLIPDGDMRKRALDKRYGLSGYVYDPYLLDNTERLLGAEREVRMPQDVRPVIEEAYHGLTDENIAAFFKRKTEEEFNEATALSRCIPFPDPQTFYLAENNGLDWNTQEVDDGFEPAMRPTTRLGEPSFRVIFCDEATAQRAMRGELTAEEERAAFMKSAAMPRKKLDNERDIQPRAIRRGMLKGCIVADSEESAHIGIYRLTNHAELGILIEEDGMSCEEG